jgi:hypothetical protein
MAEPKLFALNIMHIRIRTRFSIFEPKMAGRNAFCASASWVYATKIWLKNVSDLLLRRSANRNFSAAKF